MDIENYINAADIGLYTSGEESFGMAILETMSYGKPVLATRAGGIKEFMQHGTTGYLCGVGQVNDFAKKLLELEADRELVESLGAQALVRATRDFGVQKALEKYVAYYMKVIKACR